MRGSFDAHLNRVKLGVRDYLTWTAIEKEVATALQVGAPYINNLRREFLATGKVTVWERRGIAAPDHEEEVVEPVAIRNNNSRSKLLLHQLLALCQWVDFIKKTRIPIFIYATDKYPASTGGKDRQRT